MTRNVSLSLIRQSMMMSATERLEDAFAGGERDVLAREKLPQRGIVGHAHDGVGDLKREMEVADDPAEARGGGGISIERDFKDGFVFLRDDVNTRVARKNSG